MRGILLSGVGKGRRMEILGIMGGAPGPLVATVSHGGKIRSLRLNVSRHAEGGWHVRQPCGAWGPRCHAVPAAILMEASTLYAEEAEILTA
jgi:hypothetical protein